MDITKKIPSYFWVIGTQGGIIFIRFFSTIVLTRILFPEAFGTMLIIGSITALVELISDVGLRDSVINAKKSPIYDRYINTIWTLKVLRGCAIATTIVLLSLFAFKVYPHVSNLDVYLQIAAFSAFLRGFESTKMNQMEKNMDMMRPAIVLLGTRVITLAATILIASIHATALSIVLGEVVASVCLVILSHKFLVGTTNRFVLEKSVIGEIFRYGRWILLSTILTWAIREGHKFFLGLILSTTILGFYSLASNIASVTRELLSSFGVRWAFPKYSTLIMSDELDARALRIRVVLVIAGSSITFCLLALSSQIVSFLYEDTYSSVSPFIKIIAIGSMGMVISDCYVPIFRASGDSLTLLKLRAIQATILCSFLYTGFHKNGGEGVVLFTAIAQLFFGPCAAFMVSKHFSKKRYLFDSLLYTAPFAIALWIQINALETVFMQY